MKKILIVEDHADIRKLLKMTLEFDDFEIHEASTGDAGLAMAKELGPEVVLLDIMMPGSINGLEVCRRIKADVATRHTKVILLTARVQSGDRVAGFEAGEVRMIGGCGVGLGLDGRSAVTCDAFHLLLGRTHRRPVGTDIDLHTAPEFFHTRAQPVEITSGLAHTPAIPAGRHIESEACDGGHNARHPLIHEKSAAPP